MRTRASAARSRRRSPLVVVAAAAILFLSTAPAGAAETDPVGELTKVVEEVVTGVTGSTGSTAPAPTRTNTALASVEDDDPNKEMADPVSPDHASADNLTATIVDPQGTVHPVAGVGQTDATIGDDDSPSADASALSLGGNEIIGAHAEGNESNSAGDPLEPVCDESGGALCATVVGADASSSDKDGTQTSSSSTEVANACVGGDDATNETCSGPVGAGVLTSESDISRGSDGHTEASSSSAVADVCVGEANPLTGDCTLGVEAVNSSGESSSDGNTSSKTSEIAALQVNGTEYDVIAGEPQAIEVLPDMCATDTYIACLFLNQGETYLGSAGHAVTALDAALLNGTVLATISHSETLVHKFPADVPPAGPSGPGGSTGGSGAGDGAGSAGGALAGDGVLPNTGGVLSGLLSLALFGLALGSFLVAWSRRVALTGVTPAGAALADGTA